MLKPNYKTVDTLNREFILYIFSSEHMLFVEKKMYQQNPI